ncbi:MAG: glutaredoxin family protein [Promethearchaeota archaeon]
MRIRLFSTPDCPFCKKTRELLRKYEIEFEDKNVLEDEKARTEMIKISKQIAVPVIEITRSNTVEIIAGFDEEKIKKLLNLEGKK